MSTFEEIIENLPDDIVKDLAGFFRHELQLRQQRYNKGRVLYLNDKIEVKVVNYHRIKNYYLYDVVECASHILHTNVPRADLYPWEDMGG